MVFQGRKGNSDIHTKYREVNIGEFAKQTRSALSCFISTCGVFGSLCPQAHEQQIQSTQADVAAGSPKRTGQSQSGAKHALYQESLRG